MKYGYRRFKSREELLASGWTEKYNGKRFYHETTKETISREMLAHLVNQYVEYQHDQERWFALGFGFTPNMFAPLEWEVGREYIRRDGTAIICERIDGEMETSKAKYPLEFDDQCTRTVDGIQHVKFETSNYDVISYAKKPKMETPMSSKTIDFAPIAKEIDASTSWCAKGKEDAKRVLRKQLELQGYDIKGDTRQLKQGQIYAYRDGKCPSDLRMLVKDSRGFKIIALNGDHGTPDAEDEISRGIYTFKADNIFAYIAAGGIL